MCLLHQYTDNIEWLDIAPNVSLMDSRLSLLESKTNPDSRGYCGVDEQMAGFIHIGVTSNLIQKKDALTPNSEVCC
ncbi:hypothetical protein T265_06702 [Opisthorchis viverrini]|uniref:Uncharacterized protein n=1 Tax=Opisthorchis viverrini TaxID=6198 RepID=A0A074ZF88_OPIVI|nr:hypothetical protein T265_06702 [Opisthorchis viverrini]KER25951.1 hypothetical protein T265_06702 [Opisthorchis viverrini]